MDHRIALAILIVVVSFLSGIGVIRPTMRRLVEVIGEIAGILPFDRKRFGHGIAKPTE